MQSNDGSFLVGGALEKNFMLTTLLGATCGKNEKCSYLYQNVRIDALKLNLSSNITQKLFDKIYTRISDP